MELLSEIQSLIAMHQEGPYWDYKREWYGKEKEVDNLLILYVWRIILQIEMHI